MGRTFFGDASTKKVPRLRRLSGASLGMTGKLPYAIALLSKGGAGHGREQWSPRLENRSGRSSASIVAWSKAAQGSFSGPMTSAGNGDSMLSGRIAGRRAGAAGAPPRRVRRAGSPSMTR